MAFGTATVITNLGKGIAAKRLVGATPSQAEPKYIGVGVGATGAARTAVAADTALSSAVESRTAGTPSTVTTTQTDDTYQVAGSVTATAARAIDEAALFDAASAGSMFMSATFAVINLDNGDSLTLTMKCQFT